LVVEERKVLRIMENSEQTLLAGHQLEHRPTVIKLHNPFRVDT
jgi:hypothetical protein